MVSATVLTENGSGHLHDAIGTYWAKGPGHFPGRGGLLFETPMGTLHVIVDPSRLDGLPQLLQRCEPVLIPTYVAELAIKRVAEGIVRRLTGQLNSNCTPGMDQVLGKRQGTAAT